MFIFFLRKKLLKQTHVIQEKEKLPMVIDVTKKPLMAWLFGNDPLILMKANVNNATSL